MNFLSGSCLARYGKIYFWTIDCNCRDLWKTVNMFNIDDIKHKPRPSMYICDRGLKNNLCNNGNLSIHGSFINWIQVRFNKEYPRLHRDLSFPNFDAYRKDEFKDVRKTGWGLGDEKPGFTYVLGFFGLMASAYCLKTEVVHFVSFMAPAADVLALASIEVDISSIAPGGCATHKWRGKPLFVKNRTAADIDLEAKTEVSTLRDPESIENRTTKPEWLVVIGICTHLGCVPIPNSGDWSGGFYCPCHGSHYDNAGRIRKGPAPTNLEVPPYKFLSDNVILVG